MRCAREVVARPALPLWDTPGIPIGEKRKTSASLRLCVPIAPSLRIVPRLANKARILLCDMRKYLYFCARIVKSTLQK